MVRARGFSLMEAMVSVAVLGIIATISVFSLLSSTRTDQLNTAARVLAADLRTVQSQALTASNIKTCLNAGGTSIVCEASTAGCAVPAQCAAGPTQAVGIHFTKNATSYTFFADIQPAMNDWIRTAATEDYLTRKLDQAGAPNVKVSNITITSGAPASVDVAFERQNGSTVIKGCRVSQGCSTDITLTITLQQTQSLATRQVIVNAYTGRISIQ